MVLESTDVLDHETVQPAPGPELAEWLEHTPDWEPDDELPEMLIEHLSFPSPDPDKVPLSKLQDSSALIVTAREATLLSDALERALAAGPAAWPDLSHLAWLRDRDQADREREVADLLEEFRDFSRAAAEQGGFWAS
jgi:hypothetical protein